MGRSLFYKSKTELTKNMHEILTQQHRQTNPRPEQLRAMIGEAAKWELVAHQLALALCGGDEIKAFKLIQDVTENVCAYQRESINELESIIQNTL